MITGRPVARLYVQKCNPFHDSKRKKSTASMHRHGRDHRPKETPRNTAIGVEILPLYYPVNSRKAAGQHLISSRERGTVIPKNGALPPIYLSRRPQE